MTIGILICDEFKSEYVEAFGTYPSMFANLLPEVNQKVYLACNNDLPSSPHECDAWIISGSRSSVYNDDPWITELMNLVRTIDQEEVPCVGICFGHQLIAESLGGKVQKASVGWCVGIHHYEMVQQMEWMNPQTQNLRLLMMCQDQVVSLPKRAQILARSEDAPVAMYSISQHMLGVQGHPEFSKSYVRTLIQNRKDRISHERSIRGLASLEEDHDRDIIRQWIYRYINK